MGQMPNQSSHKPNIWIVYSKRNYGAHGNQMWGEVFVLNRGVIVLETVLLRGY